MDDPGGDARRVGLLDSALGLVAPPLCWGCGTQIAPSVALCRRCRAELRWLGGESVALAGVEVWAPLAYEGPVRAVVAGLKFRGAAGLAPALAAQIVASAPARLLAPPVVLVPVPLHPARERRRGYNQAERIAAAIAVRTGLRVDDCLRRRRSARGRQVGRGRAERLTGLAGAVELHPGATAPERVLLVDDVATTGATLAACASALRTAGTLDVAATAYARTPGR